MSNTGPYAAWIACGWCGGEEGKAVYCGCGDGPFHPECLPKHVALDHGGRHQKEALAKEAYEYLASLGKGRWWEEKKALIDAVESESVQALLDLSWGYDSVHEDGSVWVSLVVIGGQSRASMEGKP